MHIDKLSLNNFRCFPELELPLDPRFNVMFGINGAGKTALLDALAIALDILPAKTEGRDLDENDIRLRQPQGLLRSRERLQEVKIEVEGNILGKESAGGRSFSRGDKHATLTSSGETLKKLLQRRVDEQPKLPVIAYYGSKRTWSDQQPKDEPRDTSRLSGRAGCLHAGLDLMALRAWWRDMDHRRQAGQPVGALSAVEAAARSMLGDDTAPPEYSPQDQDGAGGYSRSRFVFAR